MVLDFFEGASLLWVRRAHSPRENTYSHETPSHDRVPGVGCVHRVDEHSQYDAGERAQSHPQRGERELRVT